MNNDFIEYCKEARREFVNKFMRTYPTTSERVMAEDLLIAYDQLMQRHEEMRGALAMTYGSLHTLKDDNLTQSLCGDRDLVIEKLEKDYELKQILDL